MYIITNNASNDAVKHVLRNASRNICRTPSSTKRVTSSNNTWRGSKPLTPFICYPVWNHTNTHPGALRAPLPAHRFYSQARVWRRFPNNFCHIATHLLPDLLLQHPVHPSFSIHLLCLLMHDFNSGYNAIDASHIPLHPGRPPRRWRSEGVPNLWHRNREPNYRRHTRVPSRLRPLVTFNVQFLTHPGNLVMFYTPFYHNMSKAPHRWGILFFFQIHML